MGGNSSYNYVHCLNDGGIKNVFNTIHRYELFTFS